MFSKKRLFTLIVLVTILALLPITALAGDTPPPPTKDWGCSPGYWKNHTEHWSPVTTDTMYNALFGGYDFDPDINLLQALRLRGGKVFSIARHNAAEYLNTHADYANCDDDSPFKTLGTPLRRRAR
jgi:hypothetical protein